uniref:TNase-like domain-containing protein n=1 Tax=viral metagenome TaxID=1070528 RepID=A0A6C0D8T6_9ZZZZ
MRRLINSLIRSINCFNINNTNDNINNPSNKKETISDEQIIYDWKNTIPFVPPITSGYVIKVYDGDTITIASKLPYPNSPVYRFPVRLIAIDTPEIHGKNEDEKEAAKVAQQALEKLILNQTVMLKNVTTEKYGRILANIYLGEIDISEWMLKNKYAVKYDGGSKKIPNSWIKYQLTGKYE